MKKLIAVILCTVMLAVCCAPAMALQPQYSSTAQFLAALDEAGIIYTLEGIDDDGDEKVRIAMQDEDYGIEYDILCYFEQNEENAAMRVWNLLDFEVDDFYTVLRLCNQVNYDYRYAAFVLDETDYSVTVSEDLIYRSNDVGPIALEGLRYIMQIINKCYGDFAPYAK